MWKFSSNMLKLWRSEKIFNNWNLWITEFPLTAQRIFLSRLQLQFSGSMEHWQLNLTGLRRVKGRLPKVSNDKLASSFGALAWAAGNMPSEYQLLIFGSPFRFSSPRNGVSPVGTERNTLPAARMAPSNPTVLTFNIILTRDLWNNGNGGKVDVDSSLFIYL